MARRTRSSTNDHMEGARMYEMRSRRVVALIRGSSFPALQKRNWRLREALSFGYSRLWIIKIRRTR